MTEQPIVTLAAELVELSGLPQDAALAFVQRAYHMGGEQARARLGDERRRLLGENDALRRELRLDGPQTSPAGTMPAIDLFFLGQGAQRRALAFINPPAIYRGVSRVADVRNLAIKHGVPFELVNFGEVDGRLPE